MNIGVMGGTFDPVHNGHLIVAEEAKARLDLSEVVFVPAGRPWQKADRAISAAEHRLEMVRLATADKPYFKLATLDIERAGPSYTIDTISELRTHIDSKDELFFILGWDSLVELPQWRDASQLVTLSYLVAAPRPGYPRPDLKVLEAEIPGISARVVIMDKPEIDISATDIRQRLAGGLSIHHLVPEPVTEYIRQNKLYLPK